MNNNSVRTVFLMTLVAMLFMFVGQMVAGTTGVIIAFAVAMAMNFYSYWKSDQMVLKMYDAQQVSKQSHPRLYAMMEELVQNANLPMPKLYIIPQRQPNAFATGRNPEHSAVAFTQGILQTLDPQELRGVAAHELAHIKNRDILTSTVVTTMVSAISMLGQLAYFIPMGNRDRGNPLVLLIVLITAPIAAMLLRAAVSRTREFEADREGAEISRNPAGLASALQNIQKSAKEIPMKVSESAMRSTSHMFPVNPFSGNKLMSLFSTHPPTEERVQRLMKMKRSDSYNIDS